MDGTDIALIDPRHLHRHVGVVEQEPLLFDRSIAANVLYGRGNAGRHDSAADLWAALEDAGAKDFVGEMSSAVDTPVGKLGTKLSGGCLLYTSPSPRDKRQSRMPSSA